MQRQQRHGAVANRLDDVTRVFHLSALWDFEWGQSDVGRGVE